MEVPVINRISDFDVGVNDPSFSSRSFAVSGVGKLHHAYSFLKWGSALFLIALFASFTALITRIKSLILRSRNVDVSLPPPALLYDYDSNSDSSCSSDSSDDDEDYDDDKEQDLDDGDLRVRDDDDEKGTNGNIPWMRRFSRSFGDLLSWPDLGGHGSSGVVKLWDHLDIDKEGSHRNAVASFLTNCVDSLSLPPEVLLAAEKKGYDAVEVSAWDARAGFGMPALLAEWRQPGRLLGKIVKVNAGDVNKIYVGDYVSGEITVGDLRMVNGALTELTVSDVVTMVRCRRRH
uniref:Transmembrane protein n=1 Tax=Noccaea caerulescens TaxID=107243 RepID=A0A1J3DP37_NOCCA